MSTPAIIYLCLIFVGLLVGANEHGKPKTGEHNFWFTFIGAAISVGLLYWGGFFS